MKITKEEELCITELTFDEKCKQMVEIDYMNNLTMLAALALKENRPHDTND